MDAVAYEFGKERFSAESVGSAITTTAGLLERLRRDSMKGS